jgi:hypothetical protein
MPRTQRTGRGIRLFAQPLPSVEPALLLAALLEELDDRVLPAFDRADFDGLLMLLTSFHVTARMALSTDKPVVSSANGLAPRHRAAQHLTRAVSGLAGRGKALGGHSGNRAFRRTRLSYPVDASSLGA